MFWVDEIAQKIKERNLPLEWVDDMKTPSGRIHVGSLRGVMINDLVAKCLAEKGVNTKSTYLFNDHDPMDGLPVYLPKEFEQYLGLPLFKVPSPNQGMIVLPSCLQRFEKVLKQMDAAKKLSGLLSYIWMVNLMMQ